MPTFSLEDLQEDKLEQQQLYVRVSEYHKSTTVYKNVVPYERKEPHEPNAPNQQNKLNKPYKPNQINLINSEPYEHKEPCDEPYEHKKPCDEPYEHKEPCDEPYEHKEPCDEPYEPYNLQQQQIIQKIILCEENTNVKFVSQMECLIQNIFDEDLHLTYRSEKQFSIADGYYKNLDSIANCKYDFFIPKYRVIVEYDGEQHFSPINKYGGIETFERYLTNDNLKNDFCFVNNIPILRLPYTFSKLRKKKRMEIEHNIRYFIEKRKVPSDIIDFYRVNNVSSNYAEVAQRLNFMQTK